jgi:hypothetical protein
MANSTSTKKEPTKHTTKPAADVSFGKHGKHNCFIAELKRLLKMLCHGLVKHAASFLGEGKVRDKCNRGITKQWNNEVPGSKHAGRQRSIILFCGS